MTDLRIQLLSELPELDELTKSEFEENLHGKNSDFEQEATLAIFLNKEEEQKEWRRLSLIFPEIEVKIVNCFDKKISHMCENMHLGRLPRAGLFRSSRGYDLNYGECMRDPKKIMGG